VRLNGDMGAKLGLDKYEHGSMGVQQPWLDTLEVYLKSGQIFSTVLKNMLLQCIPLAQCYNHTHLHHLFRSSTSRRLGISTPP
jgi:hypothetical protein